MATALAPSSMLETTTLVYHASNVNEKSKIQTNAWKAAVVTAFVAGVSCMICISFSSVQSSHDSIIQSNVVDTSAVPAQWRSTNGQCTMEDKAMAFSRHAWSWTGEWRPLLTKYTNKCYSKLRLTFDEQCMENKLTAEPLQLTRECAQCYVASSKCATQNCKVACLWSDSSPACHNCVDEICTPPAEECSGIPAADPTI